MPSLNPGDLVTFPLRDGKYGVAKLVHIDELALNDLYHFSILDAVVDGIESADTDEFGRRLEREHDAGPIESAPQLIEHVVLAREALDASDLSVVSASDVDEADLVGYHTWLQLRYEDALRRGAIRERIDVSAEFDVVDEEPDDDDYEEVSDDEELRDDEESSNDEERSTDDPPRADVDSAAGESDAAVAASGNDDTGAPATGPESVGAVTLGLQHVGLGDALVRQRAIFEREAYRDSTLGRFILGLADDSERVDETVRRFLDGDFGAGDELMEYGEQGMRALGTALDSVDDPQLADDILHVLVNSGEPAAYERVAAFMATHGSSPADSLYASAVRAYCYAVMITSGEPEVLRKHLPMLEAVNDPELTGDVRAAREALASE